MSQRHRKFGVTPQPWRQLSTKEQVIGAALTLIIDSLLISITYFLNWRWFLYDGRVTLVLPSLITFGLWYYVRVHPSNSDHAAIVENGTVPPGGVNRGS